MPASVHRTGLHCVTSVTRDIDVTLLFLTEIVGLGFVLDNNRLGAGRMHHISLGVEGTDNLQVQIAVLDERGIGHPGVVDQVKMEDPVFQGVEGPAL